MDTLQNINKNGWKDRVNAAAQEVVRYPENEYALKCSRQFETIMRELNAHYSKVFSEGGYTPRSRLCYEDAFSIALMKALRTYSADRSQFTTYFETVLKNQMIDCCKHEKRHSLHTESADENEAAPPREELSEQSAEYMRRLLIICDSIITQRRDHSRKNAICYAPLFFTDTITYAVGLGNLMELFVKRYRQRFDSASELGFLNTFMAEHCESVADVNGVEYRMLSDFSQLASDEGRSCRGKGKRPYIHYLVYSFYLDKAYGHKLEKQGVSNQRSKYFKMYFPR